MPKTSGFRFEMASNKMLHWMLAITTCQDFQAEINEELKRRGVVMKETVK